MNLLKFFLLVVLLLILSNLAFAPGGGYEPPDEGGGTGGGYEPPDEGGGTGGGYEPPDEGGGTAGQPTPSPSPTETPTSTPTSTPTEPPLTCSPHWFCVDGDTRAFRDADCVESMHQRCGSGEECVNGACEGIGCSAGLVCWNGFVVYRNADCSLGATQEFCYGGCENGHCCNTCNDFSGCGSFENGCGKTIECGCSVGQECVSGKCECVPLQECGEKYECGIVSNGCGGTLQCGECNQGYKCNEFFQCIEEKSGLKIKGISAKAFGTYAIISWKTTIEAVSGVEFGKSSLGNARMSKEKFNHFVFLDSLEKNTSYNYRVFAQNGERIESEVLSFNTGESAGEFKILFLAVNPDTTGREGEAFNFTAITNYPKPKELEFEWNYGDGATEKAGASVFHSFYGIQGEESFTVSVKATAPDGNTASASTEVTVLEALFFAIVNKPLSSQKYSKKEDLEIELSFFEKGGKSVDCNNVELRVSFAGKLVEMQCDGNALGKMGLWLGLKEFEILYVEAVHKVNGEFVKATTRVPVYLEAENASARLLFEEEKYYLGQEIGKAEVRFLLDERFVVVPKDLEAVLVSGEKEKEISVSRESMKHDFDLVFGHTVSEEDIENGLKLKFSGRDASGNSVDQVTEVPVGKENPNISIAVLGPSEGFREFAFGQVMLLRARLLASSNALKREKLRVSCNETGLDREMEFNEAKGEYSAEILLPGPETGIDSLVFKLDAEGVLDAKTVKDVEYVEIGLSNELLAEFVFPHAGKNSVLGGEIKSVLVKLSQPNGLPFKQGSVIALLSVEGENREIALEFGESQNLYSAGISPALGEGKHFLELNLAGGFRGSDAVEIEVVEDTFLQSLAFNAGIAAVVLILALVLTFYLRNSLAERRVLLREKNRLLGLKKKFKYEFFKRHISQREFNASKKQVGSGIKAIDFLLKKKSWLYTGFLRTLHRNSNPEKFPERLQPSMLEPRLAGRKAEFSREEIAKAMAEEGYSMAVIETVLSRLFK